MSMWLAFHDDLAEPGKSAMGISHRQSGGGVSRAWAIAVKEVEHRPMMAEQFPLWADQVEYWHIDDIDCAQPEEALPVLDEHVRALVAKLGDSKASAAA